MGGTNGFSPSVPMRLIYCERLISMTIRVELNPETEARLIAEARAKGLPMEKVAEQLLKEALTGHSSSRGGHGFEFATEMFQYSL
jgi:hypothetical protein